VPKRWVLNMAYLSWNDPDVEGGVQTVMMDTNPLSVVAYSQQINKMITWTELQPHLHYSEERPDAIPWVSSHYEEDWGFCIPKTVYDCLPRDATYRVVIDAEFTDEPMSVGVGKANQGDGWTPSSYNPQLLLAAHICHPMQANDDISGVAVLCEVARRLTENPLPDDALGVRFLFCPETIGSTAYLSQNEWLIPHIKAGVFVEMAGTDGGLRLQHSWQHTDPIDKIAFYALAGQHVDNGTPFHPEYSFTSDYFGTVRANDEKIINGPGVDIPCISLIRWPYPEYHTSDDNPSIIHEDKLQEMADVVERIVRIYCTDYVPKRTFRGYLNTRKYGVWVDWTKDWDLNVATQKIIHLLDGELSVFEISEAVGLDYWTTRAYVEQLREKGLVTVD